MFQIHIFSYMNAGQDSIFFKHSNQHLTILQKLALNAPPSRSVSETTSIYTSIIILTV